MEDFKIMELAKRLRAVSKDIAPFEETFILAAVRELMENDPYAIIEWLLEYIENN